MQAGPLFPGLAKGHCLSPLERIDTDGGYRANFKALRHVVWTTHSVSSRAVQALLHWLLNGIIVDLNVRDAALAKTSRRQGMFVNPTFLGAEFNRVSESLSPIAGCKRLAEPLLLDLGREAFILDFVK
jgi:hypothetical protein